MEMDTYYCMKGLIDRSWTMWESNDIPDTQKQDILIRFMGGETFPLYPPGYSSKQKKEGEKQ